MYQGRLAGGDGPELRLKRMEQALTEEHLEALNFLGAGVTRSDFGRAPG